MAQDTDSEIINVDGKNISTNKTKKWRRKWSNLAPHIRAVVFVCLFAAIGTIVLVLTHAATIPGPINLSDNAVSTTGVSLTWSAPSTTGVTGYSIIRNGLQIGSTDSETLNYYDSGLTPGDNYIYTVTAQLGSDETTSSSPQLNVSTGSNPTVISQCGANISTPGNYVLTSSIAYSAGNNCINIENTNDVSLDCQNNGISVSSSNFDVSINNVDNFLVVNCNFSIPIPGNTNSSLYVTNSNYGTIENNKFGNSTSVAQNEQTGLSTDDDSYMVLNNNSVIDGSIYLGASTNTYIGHNTVKDDPSPGGGMTLDLTGGSNNLIYNNSLNGGWNDGENASGNDDGIFLSNETSDMVSTNKISGDWDCGIETENNSNYNTFTNNTINDTQKGIGGWDSDSWLGNTVSNNTFSDIQTMFLFYNDGGPPAGQTNIYFKDNTFSGNDATSYVAGSTVVSAEFNFTTIQTLNGASNPGTFVLGNNVFSNNNFGLSIYAPAASPASVITDGGNNTCGQQVGSGEPITCIGTPEPIIQVETPQNGATVSGTVPLTAAIYTDGNALQTTQYSVDRKVVATDNSGNQYPSSEDWNSSTVSDGTHILSITATTTAGLTSTTQLSFNVLNGNACSSAPSSPTGLEDTDNPVLSNKVDLSWQAAQAGSSCTLAGYNIYRNGGTTPYATTTSTSYTDTNVDDSTPYTYQVSAIDTDGHESALSPTPPLSVITADECPSGGTGSAKAPLAPSELREAANSYTSITVAWNASPDNDGCVLTGYNVYQVGDATPIYSGLNTTFTDTGLGSGSYSYYVVAYDSGGNDSPASATVPMFTESISPTTTTIEGVVSNKAGQPLVNAYVHTGGGASSKGRVGFYTNSLGEFMLSNIVPAKAHTYYFSLEGYKAKSVSLNDPKGTFTLNAVLVAK